MNRNKYKRIGIALLIIAVLQYLIFGCLVSTVNDIAWLENVSFMLLVTLICCGTGMMINARNENSYKKARIEEKDERNKMINLNSCTVTLFISFFSYIGVFIYMKNTGILSGLQLAVFIIPVVIGALAYGLSVVYFRNRI